MSHQFRTDIGRNSIICVDSYEDGILQGRLYSPLREMERFSSLTQFLLKMETLLDLQQTARRSDNEQLIRNRMPERRGSKATFELQILFRYHTSWQGVLRRVGENVQYQFRSVLELVVLLDDALNSQKDRKQSGLRSGEQVQPPAV